MPRLLVSVRSVSEARHALAGGCDLVDVKEPSRGSLGAAEPDTAAAIADAVWECGETAVSVALGELSEWPADRPVRQVGETVSFVKMGLSRFGPDGLGRWADVRRRFDDAAGRPLDWIAVLYADPSAGGPEPERLIESAVATHCRGVLVDTYAKDGQRLFDHRTSHDLADWRDRAAAAGLTFAVAGSLRMEDLPSLAAVRPDVVAIRGAACRNADRSAEVCVEAVRGFRAALATEFGGSQVCLLPGRDHEPA